MNYMVENPDTVTISRELYESLVEESQKLAKLEAAGVDNWEWYEEALNNE